jgi:hypothetical protein
VLIIFLFRAAAERLNQINQGFFNVGGGVLNDDFALKLPVFYHFASRTSGKFHRQIFAEVIIITEVVMPGFFIENRVAIPAKNQSQFALGNFVFLCPRRVKFNIFFLNNFFLHL